MKRIILLIGIMCFVNSMAIIILVRTLDRKIESLKRYTDKLLECVWDDIRHLYEKVYGDEEDEDE